jgi:hypothetical protein
MQKIMKILYLIGVVFSYSLTNKDLNMDSTFVLEDEFQRIELNSDTESDQFGIVKSLQMKSIDLNSGEHITYPSLVDSNCNSTFWKLDVLVEGHSNVFTYDYTDGVTNRTIIGQPNSTHIQV